VELPSGLPLLCMIPHHADSVNAPLPLIFFAWTFEPRLVTLSHNHVHIMSSPSYRPEDQFQERLNAERLKELFGKRDYQGLLELALLLNHQASFNNSRAYWAILESAKNMSEEFSLDKYIKMAQDLD
jgi:hypothetical protein